MKYHPKLTYKDIGDLATDTCEHKPSNKSEDK
jgi:hypothetical protein